MWNIADVRRVRTCYRTINGFPCKDFVFDSHEKALEFAETHKCSSLQIFDIDDNLLYTKVDIHEDDSF